MSRTVSVISWVIITLVVGFISSFFQSGSSDEWYNALQRSSLTPPDWLFPVAWTVLYVLMGVSVGLLKGVVPYLPVC